MTTGNHVLLVHQAIK